MGFDEPGIDTRHAHGFDFKLAAHGQQTRVDQAIEHH